MTIFQRATKSIIRRPVKTVILFLIIIILGSVIAGAVSVQIAISNTVLNLRRGMPPVVTLVSDWDYFETWVDLGDGAGFLDIEEVDPERVTITTEHLYALAELKYVRDFNFSVLARLTNTELIQQEFTTGGGWGVGGWDWVYNGHGIATPNILYVTEGVIEIVEGRLPTEEELSNQSNITPILISFTIAQANSLHVGSTLEMFSVVSGCIPNNYGGCNIGFESYTEDYAFARLGHEFKIVGIFDMVNRNAIITDPAEMDLQRTLLQTMFIPAHTAEEFGQFEHEQAILQREAGEAGSFFVNPDEEFSHTIQNTFVLYDPLYIDDFRRAAYSILPDLVIVEDLSNIFANIQMPMETLQEITNSALLFSFGASIIVLGLLITLFLYDRRHEIGVYLALGEKRIKIVTQILSEVLITAIVGLSVALLIGNIISGQISQEMIHDEITRLSQPESIMTWQGHGSQLERRGFGHQMEPEAMLEAFDVSLNVSTVVLFFVIGLGTVVISTALPMGYITKLNPKKVLMQGKIE